MSYPEPILLGKTCDQAVAELETIVALQNGRWAKGCDPSKQYILHTDCCFLSNGVLTSLVLPRAQYG